MAWNTGWTLTMRALRPKAAAVPWTRFDVATPSAVHRPRRRPPARVFLVTTAKSGPGIRTSTTANARKSAYFDHDMFVRYLGWPGRPERYSTGPGRVKVERGALGTTRGPRPVHRGGRGAAPPRTARAAGRGGRRRRPDQARRGQHGVVRGPGARRALRPAAAHRGPAAQLSFRRGV